MKSKLIIVANYSKLEGLDPLMNGCDYVEVYNHKTVTFVCTTFLEVKNKTLIKNKNKLDETLNKMLKNSEGFKYNLI